MGEPVDFVWKTEDDLQTSESWQPEPPPPPKKRRKRLWIITSVSLLLLCFAFVIAYSQLNKQANVVSHQLQDEVVAVHQLMLETAVSGDLDLFQSLLYQPKKAWGETQTALIRRDLFFNRAPLNIWLDEANAMAPITAEAVTAEFSADLTRVALMVKRPYLAQSEAGEYEAVQMQQTAVYVRKNGTWLLTEPDDAFWGDELAADSAILTITHPARDAEVTQRLVADLNDLLIDACAADIFICPDDLAISLQFMRQADALPALNRAFQLTSRYSTKNGRTYRLFLPTPTLVGLPVDEAGYQALYRGYAAQMLAALIVNLNDVTAIPVSQSDLTTQLDRFQLSLPQPVGFHPRHTAVPPPVSFPEQDIVALCRSSESMLITFDLQSESWDTVYTGNIVNMSGMANGDGILLSMWDMTGPVSQLWWWRSDAQYLVTENIRDIFVGSSFLYPGDDDQVQHVINYNTTSGQGGTTWGLLDESMCSEDVCELMPIEQWPLVSPNGRFRLNVGFNSRSWASRIDLESANGELLEQFGQGMNPVWLNDETFAFIRVPDATITAVPTQTTLVEVNISQPVSVVTELSQNDIRDAISNDEAYAADMLIGGMLPGKDDQWLIMLFNQSTSFSLAYLVQYLPETGQMALFEDFSQFETAVFLNSTSDGRYFAVGILDQGNVVLRIYDTEREQFTSYPVPSAQRGRFAWTPDGEWLLILDNDGLRLIALGHNYERWIAHDYPGCETAVWVNP